MLISLLIQARIEDLVSTSLHLFPLESLIVNPSLLGKESTPPNGPDRLGEGDTSDTKTGR